MSTERKGLDQVALPANVHPPPVSANSGLEQVFPDVWTVRGSNHQSSFVYIPVTMTVIRDSDTGDIAILNSMRVDDATVNAILDLAAPTSKVHIVRLGAFHGKYDAWWCAEFPDRCVMWALPGHNIQDGARVDKILSAQNAPLPGSCTVFVFDFPKPEAAVVLHAPKVAVFCDAIVNFSSFEYCGILCRPLFWYLVYGCCHRPGDFYIQEMTKVSSKEKFISEYERFLALDFDSYISAHGPVVIGDAKRKIRERMKTI